MSNAAGMTFSLAEIGTYNSPPTGLCELSFEGGRTATIFLPWVRGCPADLPLLCSLHGSAGAYANTLLSLSEFAERGELAVIAPHSLRTTWDVLFGSYGEDVRLIEFLIALMVRRNGIDSSRVGLAGFSEGTSYTLTVGLKNGDMFPFIIAFSPGFFLPNAAIGKLRIFISYGSTDRILPMTSAREIAQRLKSDGYHVQFEEFSGGHELPEEILEMAVDRFLRPGGMKWARTTIGRPGRRPACYRVDRNFSFKRFPDHVPQSTDGLGEWSQAT
jgi:phospholipase/carboxylesterase